MPCTPAQGICHAWKVAETEETWQQGGTATWWWDQAVMAARGSAGHAAATFGSQQKAGTAHNSSGGCSQRFVLSVLGGRMGAVQLPQQS